MNTEIMHEPPSDCSKCPRLSDYRKSINFEYPNWHNKPVRSFGSINSTKLIVGLAPGKKGANRTGRPFTGDGAGDSLFRSLIKHNLAKGKYDKNGFDKLMLLNCRITNIVKCVPPKNKPLGEEIKNCSFYLKNEIKHMKNLEKILALGRNAFNSILNFYNLSKTGNNFSHHKKIRLPDNKLLIGSYHCSRYNTNTKRLTNKMFEAVINELKY